MDHDKNVALLFKTLVDAEEAQRVFLVERKAIEGELDKRQREFKTQVDKATAALDELMKSTGEYEIIVPGRISDYKIHYTTPRESMKIIDDAAVPDEFCNEVVIRKPRLAEIKQAFIDMRDNGISFPNWGTLEMGEKKLTWKSIKKEAA